VEVKETEAETRAHIAEAIEAGQTDFETRHRTRQGEIRNVQVTAQSLDVQGRAVYQCVWRDITERKRTEEEIRRQSALISSLLDSIPDIFFFKNTEGVYLGCNPAFVEFVRRPRNEIVGKTDYDLFDKEIADSFRKQDQQMMVLRKPRHNEEFITYPDGRRVMIDTLKTPYWGPDGELVGVLGISRDITVQKQASEQLQKTNQSLEAANAHANALAEQATEANRAKSEFLAMMSHEIRTPMNAVLGMNSLLLKTPLDARQTEFARTVATSGEALLDIINDILDLSKIEAGGPLDIDEQPLSLRNLVDGVVRLLQTRAGGHGLSLASDLAGDIPPWLKGDTGRLRQVLMNLAGNGLKFTDRGGVTIRVRRLGAEAPRVWLRFEVQDTGVGISAADSARLFQAFTQVDSSATRRRGGTGLGLAISKRIVELMGGRMGLESAPGQGSLFWFEIALEVASAPAAKPAEPGASDTADAQATTLAGPLRILVAEDHEPNRRLVTYMLESLGQQAEFAVNGLEAVAAWERSDPDVIIMDCQMPRMDGFEATREIRRREAARSTDGARRVHIVALTANAVKGDSERCLAAGMDDYLSKPYTAQQLGAALNQRTAPPSREASPAETKPAPLAAVDFDPQRPAELCAELGDEGVLAIIADFLRELPETVGRLTSLVSSGPVEELARLAHSIRGIGRSIGLEKLAEHCQTLEEAANAGDSERLAELLRALPGVVEAGQSALRQWLAERAGDGRKSS
jgi:two-component system, sensor histidine kinase and response regulator